VPTRPPPPKKKPAPKKAQTNRPKAHRPGRMQRVTVAVLAIVGLAAGSGAAIGGLVSGGGSPKAVTPGAPGRAITSDEANRLAVMRFRNYQGTGVHFHTSIVGPDGTLTVDGLVDYRRSLGLAQVSGLGSSFTFEWNRQQLAAWPGTATQTTLPTKLPTGKPGVRPLNTSATAVDSVLALMLAMGADRPDNAQLLQQNGARWLSRDTIDGVAYDVLTGPAQTGAPAGGTSDALQYWISPDGHLARLDAHLGGNSTPTTIRVDAAGFHALPAKGPLA
jgi:hypothetical protein